MCYTIGGSTKKCGVGESLASPIMRKEGLHGIHCNVCAQSFKIWVIDAY